MLRNARQLLPKPFLNILKKYICKKRKTKKIPKRQNFVRTKNNFRITSLICFLFFFAFCYGYKKDEASQPGNEATDYSQTAHWLSVPAPDMAVDVFYLYPTCWQKIDSTDPNICNIDNPSMLAGATPRHSNDRQRHLKLLQMFMHLIIVRLMPVIL